MSWLDQRLHALRHTHPVPEFALVRRGLLPGLHAYTDILPNAAQSPAMRRVCPDPAEREVLLRDARIQVSLVPGFAFINTRVPCISLAWTYYATGSNVDLYMDLLHELTHLRQLSHGADLWDSAHSYVDRPTEIEGYAVAVEEGRRLGLTAEQLRRHLHNPWMTAQDVDRLLRHIDVFLQAG